MLVLSRKKNETLVIDGPCKVVVLECRTNGDVRLGIIAEKDVKIMRQELLHQEAKETVR